jgi:hypothetical protein
MRGRELRRVAAACAALMLGLLFSGVQQASAEVRIRNDPGGLISNHMNGFAQIRDSGQRVVIDGTCFSACTLVLGMIPHERLCVTRRARLGFHAAWAYAPDGRVVPSQSGTASLMQIYPPQVRSWIARRGGLTSKMIFLSGRELTSMYRACP